MADQPDPGAWTPPDNNIPGPQPGPPQPYPSYPDYPPPAHPAYPGHPPYSPYPPYPQPVKVVPAPPGSPFHRLARTPLHRWWRPLVGTLLIAVSTLLIGLIITAAVVAVRIGVTGSAGLDGADDSPFGSATADLAWNLGVLAVLTPVVLLTVRVVQRRPVGSVVSVVGRMRWRWLLTCCGLAVGFCIVSLVLSYVVWAVFSGEPVQQEGAWPGWREFLVPAAVIVVLVPLQATAEEFAFRGWLLQGIAAWTLEDRPGPVSRAANVVLRTPWVAIVVSAAMFTSLHGYTGWAMLDIFAFGALAGWLAVRTGGLEAGIAVHVFTNLMGLLLVAASGRLSDALDQGGEEWTSLLANMLALGLYALAVVTVARRRGISTVSPAN